MKMVLSRKGHAYFEAKASQSTFADGAVDRGDGFDEPLSRFEYNVRDVVGPTCGFLVTCPFKREKSATVEAQKIIEKVLERGSFTYQCVKVHTLGNCLLRLKGKSGGGKSDGLDAPLLLEKILDKLASSEPAPKFCQRFFPVQALCTYGDSEIKAAFEGIVSGTNLDSEAGLTFAVAYKAHKVAGISGDPEHKKVDVRSVLASTFQERFKNATVDLRAPKIVILCTSLGAVDRKTILCALSICSDRLVEVRSKGIFPRVLQKARPSPRKS
ncbi:hypothetical protein HOP50_02g11930 [Chloropicon primus]|uniref:Uncharacterized protein n=1 Tax=Chloropicon primus TaxID=1764295 RepID=A0A5B8MDL6_9CHLO|nr:hypothetical protein A3770_02p12060 [Chloropicon primus]UPQ97896.1 hypothetical protein HOP50_02g11930 [Chloropicon primus]|eukprot:QDZ18688.1 hypothetical protein A3770_02p12060 [Chloropicon primus]